MFFAFLVHSFYVYWQVFIVSVPVRRKNIMIQWRRWRLRRQKERKGQHPTIPIKGKSTMVLPPSSRPELMKVLGTHNSTEGIQLSLGMSASPGWRQASKCVKISFTLHDLFNLLSAVCPCHHQIPSIITTILFISTNYRLTVWFRYLSLKLWMSYVTPDFPITFRSSHHYEINI